MNKRVDSYPKAVDENLTLIGAIIKISRRSTGLVIKDLAAKAQVGRSTIVRNAMTSRQLYQNKQQASFAQFRLFSFSKGRVCCDATCKKSGCQFSNNTAAKSHQ